MDSDQRMAKRDTDLAELKKISDTCKTNGREEKREKTYENGTKYLVNERAE
jgi:hypothetical protein